MTHQQRQPRTCPRCGQQYSALPALSRRDNTTEICGNCGTAEALEDWLRFLGIKDPPPPGAEEEDR